MVQHHCKVGDIFCEPPAICMCVCVSSNVFACHCEYSVMMNQVHFASVEDEDDDTYGGFNDLTATDMTQVSDSGKHCSSCNSQSQCTSCHFMQVTLQLCLVFVITSCLPLVTSVHASSVCTTSPAVTEAAGCFASVSS